MWKEVDNKRRLMMVDKERGGRGGSHELNEHQEFV